ncbi:hypothetical protein BS78_02G166200 [Paspalum vaginatum]|nr:hypothetical protein BS78_02G166200 [Paspalum vaginatum]
MKRAVAVGAGGGKAGGTAPTDLLVCFPARQHLALMPKPICSPSRTTMDKAAAARRRQLQLHLPGTRGGSSPMFRGSSRAKQRAAGDEDEEPQSPKVTCAGQIKAGRGRPKKVKPGSPPAAAARHGGVDGDGGGARSWITVVEEIERLRGRSRSKKAGWLGAIGIRRDALPILGGALRSLRFKARCFGSLRGAAVEDLSAESDAGERGGEHGAGGGAAASVFSKWLMVLEGGGQEPLEQEGYAGPDEERGQDEDVDQHRAKKETQTDESTDGPAAPPPNALLLMRCRSAPAKGLSMSRRGTCELLDGDVEPEKGAADAVQGQGQGDGEAEEDREELVFMRTAPGFLKLSLDIAKETWVIGGGDPLARSRSCKR